MAEHAVSRRGLLASVGVGSAVALANAAPASAATSQSLDFEMYGAVGDGVTDDTNAIAACLADAVAQGKFVRANKRVYKLSSKGSIVNAWNNTTTSYAVLISNATSLDIDFGGSTFLYDTSSAGVFTPFLFQNCTTVRVANIVGKSVDPQPTSTLHRGGVLQFLECSDAQVRSAHGLNARAVVQMFRCVGSSVVDSTATGDVGLRRGAVFALYACRESKIVRCVNYEGTYDGDIGLYGGCSNCDVIDCETYNYQRSDVNKAVNNLVAQGIFVDAGCRGCSVRGCTVYGYYYGIDIKTNCTNVLVSDNTVFVGKVGIAVRRGEANDITHSTTVADNVIAFASVTHSTTAISSTASGYPVIRCGVLLEDANGVRVTSNHISAMKPSSATYQADNCAAFYVRNSAAMQSGAVISGNMVQFEQTTGVTRGRFKGLALLVRGNSSASPDTIDLAYSDNDHYVAVYTADVDCPMIDCNNADKIYLDSNRINKQWRTTGVDLCVITDCNTASIAGNRFPGYTRQLNISNVATVRIVGNDAAQSSQTSPSAYAFSGVTGLLTFSSNTSNGTISNKVFSVTNCPTVAASGNVTKVIGSTAASWYVNSGGSTITDSGNIFF